jgi:hypothetical protein
MRIRIDLDDERGVEPRVIGGVPVENTIEVRVRFATEINMAVITGYLMRKMDWNNQVLSAISENTRLVNCM